jgi:hypothetical protein
MKKNKIVLVALLISFFCANLFAETTRAEIKQFFKDYKEMVSLAEKAVKKESIPDITKVEGLMTKLTVKYGKLVLSDEWTDKDTKLYKKLTEKYGIAHKKFGKLIGSEVGNTAKDIGKEVTDTAKDIGKDLQKAGKKLKKLFE